MSGTPPAQTFAPSHLQLAIREAGPVADQAELKKKAKYAELAATHHFVPVAIETMGVLGKEAEAFFIELGRRIREETGTPIVPLLTATDRGGHAEGQCSRSAGHHHPQHLWPNIYQLGNISIRMSTLPSVLLINYIHLLLARCSRTFISNAVLPVYFKVL